MRLSSFIKCLLVASVADRVSTTSALSPDTIALYLGVHADDANELMNTNDYVNIDSTKWAATFNQSAGTVVPSDQGKRIRAQSSGDAQVSSKEAVIKIKLHVAEVADEASCLSEVTCVLCVAAAVAAATGPISSCASTAYIAIAATVRGTAGAIIPPIVLNFLRVLHCS
ncbi:hypothetical protein EAE99_011800 [Botrytis elliptica]|nr:hypothetical protein EAE99_011800 [Botrytis elliptica]